LSPIFARLLLLLLVELQSGSTTRSPTWFFISRSSEEPA
jgi:hypothetical protein